jgi:hypothetical protein
MWAALWPHDCGRAVVVDLSGVAHPHAQVGSLEALVGDLGRADRPASDGMRRGSRAYSDSPAASRASRSS